MAKLHTSNMWITGVCILQKQAFKNTLQDRHIGLIPKTIRQPIGNREVFLGKDYGLIERIEES